MNDTINADLILDYFASCEQVDMGWLDDTATAISGLPDPDERDWLLYVLSDQCLRKGLTRHALACAYAISAGSREREGALKAVSEVAPSLVDPRTFASTRADSAR